MKAVNYDKLTQPQRKAVREKYVEAQKGLCRFCYSPLSEAPEQNLDIEWSMFPPNFLKWSVHLHHDHDSGMTIGAVHAYCNAVLWQHYGE